MPPPGDIAKFAGMPGNNQPAPPPGQPDRSLDFPGRGGGAPPRVGPPGVNDPINVPGGKTMSAPPRPPRGGGEGGGGGEQAWQTYEKATGKKWTGGNSQQVKELLTLLQIGGKAGSAEANLALQKALQNPETLIALQQNLMGRSTSMPGQKPQPNQEQLMNIAASMPR